MKTVSKDIADALEAECKRLSARVKRLEAEGREEFHRIMADLTAENARLRERLADATPDPAPPVSLPEGWARLDAGADFSARDEHETYGPTQVTIGPGQTLLWQEHDDGTESEVALNSDVLPALLAAAGLLPEATLTPGQRAAIDYFALSVVNVVCADRLSEEDEATVMGTLDCLWREQDQGLHDEVWARALAVIGEDTYRACGKTGATLTEDQRRDLEIMDALRAGKIVRLTRQVGDVWLAEPTGLGIGDGATSEDLATAITEAIAMVQNR